jgi:hypothetical protein
MSDEFKSTVRIQRPAKIESDGRGRSVWAEPVESVEFELVSTAELTKILQSNDEAIRQDIEAVAESGQQGILARDTATGLFEIVSDTDLQAILDGDLDRAVPKRGSEAVYVPVSDSGKSIDELSLVSTLALKKILNKEETTESLDAVDTRKSGFDPYNKG